MRVPSQTRRRPVTLDDRSGLWNDHRMARLQVLLAAMCFGTTGTAQALGPDASSVTVGAARIAVGALLLLAAEWALGRRRGARAEEVRGWSVRPLVVGALGVAAYQLCFFAAVKDTGV